MCDQILISRSQLSSVAKVEEGAIVFWVRKGLLHSAETRDRKHKRFDGLEVKFAVILRELRSYGINLFAMASIIGQLRHAVATYESAHHPRLTPDALNALAECDFDVGAARARLARVNGATLTDIDHALEAAGKVPRDAHRDWWLGSVVWRADDYITIYRDSGEELRVGYGLPDEMPAATVLALDLSRLLDLAWLEQTVAVKTEGSSANAGLGGAAVNG